MTTDESGGPRLSRRAYLATAVAAGTLAGCTEERTAPAAGTTEATATGQGSTATEATGTETGGGPPYDLSVPHDATEWAGYDPGWEPAVGAPGGGYDVDVVAERLEIPWDLAFAPTGELFVTERTGRLLSIDGSARRTVAEPGDAIDAEALPPGSDERSWVVEGGEGGLLGVAVHPAYPEPPVVYLYYTAEVDGDRRNRVVAVDASDGGGGRTWPIVDGIPAGTFHNGGRIGFGPANHLWITTGDGDPGLEAPERPRDPAALAGAVLRVRPDGRPAAGNPELPGGDPRVFSYGHRNPQGIAWLPDATPVAAEHGPGGGDEVNVLRPGGDYGWPVAREDGDFEAYADTDFRPPVASASGWAPAGACFYTGTVEDLSGRLLVSGLVSQRVIAVTLTPDAPADGHATYHDEGWLDDSYRAASDPVLTDAFGRLRHLEQGPDGGLYALTSNRDGRAGEGFPTDRDDRLLRIRPA